MRQKFNTFSKVIYFLFQISKYQNIKDSHVYYFCVFSAKRGKFRKEGGKCFICLQPQIKYLVQSQKKSSKMDWSRKLGIIRKF